MRYTQKLRLIPEDKYRALIKKYCSTEPNDGQTSQTVNSGDKDEQKEWKEVENDHVQIGQENESGEGSKKEPQEEKVQTGGDFHNMGNKMSFESILDSLPKYLRAKGNLVLRMISNHPRQEIDWDHAGRIIYKGQVVENTNIMHLLRNALSPLQKFTPIGADDFNQALIDMNIPISSIRPKKTRKGESLPPPPGRRVKVVNRVKKSSPKKGKKSKTKNFSWVKLFK